MTATTDALAKESNRGLVAPMPVASSSPVAVLRALIELVKPQIMMMALLTAAAGFALAPGPTPSGELIWAVLGTALIVGAANAMNMYLERDLDCLMVRTQRRPLPEMRLRPITALALGVVLFVAAVPVMWLGSNLLTAVLGVIAFISYVFLYTPLKQLTHWAVWVGAIPGAMPTLMGYTAASGKLDAAGLAVFGILFIWQIPHFHAIGFYRESEYRAAGLQTLAGAKGRVAARRSIVTTLVMQVFISFLAVYFGVSGGIYTIAAAVLGAIVLRQAILGLREGDESWARKVFLLSIVYLPVLYIALVLGGKLLSLKEVFCAGMC